MRRFLIILLLCSSAFGQWQSGVKPMLGIQVDWAHPLSKGLAGYWLFNEGSGNKVFDLSGNGNGGTNTGAIWVPGKSGSCLDFDDFDDIDCGSSGYMGSSGFAAGNFTVLVRFNVHTFGGNRSIIENRVGGSANYFMLQTVGTETVRFMYHDGTDLFTNCNVIGFLTNTWYDVCVTLSTISGAKLYKDAIYKDSDNAPAATLTSGRAVKIGSSNYGYDGLIEFVCIFNRVLSASEIAELYREPFGMFVKDDIAMLATAAVPPPPPSGQVIIIIQSAIPLFLIFTLVCLIKGRKVS